MGSTGSPRGTSANHFSTSARVRLVVDVAGDHEAGVVGRVVLLKNATTSSCVAAVRSSMWPMVGQL